MKLPINSSQNNRCDRIENNNNRNRIGKGILTLPVNSHKNVLNHYPYLPVIRIVKADQVDDSNHVVFLHNSIHFDE